MVFECECCQFSTPFKYNLKQHLATKRHLSKMKDVPVDEVHTLKLKLQEQEKLLEEQRQLLETQTNQMEQMLRKLVSVSANVHTNTNTNTHSVNNIHLLLHPDMHLSQLTTYDYQLLLKKIQDRDFEKIEDGEAYTF